MPNFKTFVLTLTLLAVVLTFNIGCRPLQVNGLADRLSASNQRDWHVQFSKLPYAVGKSDGLVEVHNIRNNLYLAEDDFVSKYYDRSFNISDIRSVDFIVCPFRNKEYIAHTMLSFRLADDTYIGVSAEIRTEKSEAYSPVQGFVRQYELIYVVADERDIIRLRTKHRDADVYIYRTVASPEQSQALFVDMMERANKLAQQPEFYNTLRNNCTTNILDHVNSIKPGRLFYNWKVFLPGYSAEYAYDEGILDRSVPFGQLKQEAWINDLAARHFEDPDFSSLIRERLRIPPATAQAKAKNAKARNNRLLPWADNALNDLQDRFLPTPGQRRAAQLIDLL